MMNTTDSKDAFAVTVALVRLCSGTATGLTMPVTFTRR